MPYLRLVEGPDRGRVYSVLDGDLIGSTAECKVYLPLADHPCILCRIRSNDHLFWIDLAAPGRLYVNGHTGARGDMLDLLEGSRLEVPELGFAFLFLLRLPQTSQLHTELLAPQLSGPQADHTQELPGHRPRTTTPSLEATASRPPVGASGDPTLPENHAVSLPTHSTTIPDALPTNPRDSSHAALSSAALPGGLPPVTGAALSTALAAVVAAFVATGVTLLWISIWLEPRLNTLVEGNLNGARTSHLDLLAQVPTNGPGAAAMLRPDAPSPAAETTVVPTPSAPPSPPAAPLLSTRTPPREGKVRTEASSSAARHTSASTQTREAIRAATDVGLRAPLVKAKIFSEAVLEFELDGQRMGGVPYNNTVPEGLHTFTFREPSSGKSVRFDYTVPSDGMVMQINWNKGWMAVNRRKQYFDQLTGRGG